MILTMAKADTNWRKRLLALRERLDITQAEAAARIGVTRRAWIKWEKDGATPSIPFAKLLDQFCRHPENFPE